MENAPRGPSKTEKTWGTNLQYNKYQKNRQHIRKQTTGRVILNRTLKIG